MGRVVGKARINGRLVDVETYEPEGTAVNPDARQAVLACLGIGMGAYNAARNLAEFIPNPNGIRLKRALPWAVISATSFFGAKHCGRLKRPVQGVGVVTAIKATYEYLRG